jgi:hypothetical protein
MIHQFTALRQSWWSTVAMADPRLVGCLIERREMLSREWVYGLNMVPTRMTREKREGIALAAFRTRT